MFLSYDHRFVAAIAILTIFSSGGWRCAQSSLVVVAAADSSSSRTSNHHEYYSTNPSHFTGNRVVERQRDDDEEAILEDSNRVTFPSIQNVELEDCSIVWAVAVPVKDDDTTPFVFVVTCQNSKAYLIQQEQHMSTWTATRLEPYRPRSAVQPPLVRQRPLDSSDSSNNEVVVETVHLAETANVAPLTHPVPVQMVGDNNLFLYIAETTGDVVLWDEMAQFELDRLTDIQALPDGVLVLAPTAEDSASATISLYGGSTDSYRHCVLGDCVEATRLIVLDIDNNLRITVRINVQLDGGQVFEGLSPLFVDDQRILTTVAEPSNGARLQVYHADTGAVLSTGPTVGWGWRHQLCLDHFLLGTTSATWQEEQPDSPLLIANVVAPHVLLEVQFLELPPPSHYDDSQTLPQPLQEKAVSPGLYTTHWMGSRNLDAGVGGDWNGNGRPEVVVLSADDDRNHLVGLELDDGDSGVTVQEAWKVRLAGKVTTNLAAAANGKRLALGAGSGNVFGILEMIPVGTTETTMSTSTQSAAAASAANSPATTTMTTTTTCNLVLLLVTALLSGPSWFRGGWTG